MGGGRRAAPAVVVLPAHNSSLVIEEGTVVVDCSTASSRVPPETAKNIASMAVVGTTTMTAENDGGHGDDADQTEHPSPGNQPSRRDRASGNFLVSEQEDNEGTAGDCCADDEVSPTAAADSANRVGSFASAAATTTAVAVVAAIPRDEAQDDDEEGLADGEEEDGNDGDEEDDESDYEYEYDDDDDGHYSGFLVSGPHASSTSAAISASASAAPQDAGSTHKVEDDEDEERASKPPAQPSNTVVAAAPACALSAAAGSGEASTADAENATERKSSSVSDHRTKPKWREPSRSAVSMSLRAESEKTGSRRRLAADLYKIMTADTAEAGFQIAPKSEDSMDRWTVRLFAFDGDSNLHKDLLVLGFDHVELEMSFPDQYPFEPPFVRVVRPRFKRQTGFVMNGALCMELLTTEGWNPVNDIESVIVSVRSLLVVGDGRLQAAADMPEPKREALLAKARAKEQADEEEGVAGGVGRFSVTAAKRKVEEIKAGEEEGGDELGSKNKRRRTEGGVVDAGPSSKTTVGSYTTAEARAAYSHLSDYHKKRGWDSSGWWARKG